MIDNRKLVKTILLVIASLPVSIIRCHEVDLAFSCLYGLHESVYVYKRNDNSCRAHTKLVDKVLEVVGDAHSYSVFRIKNRDRV